jgi:hypothetical protein
MSRSIDAGRNGGKRWATPAMRATNVEINLITAGLLRQEKILSYLGPAGCAEKHRLAAPTKKTCSASRERGPGISATAPGSIDGAVASHCRRGLL